MKFRRSLILIVLLGASSIAAPADNSAINGYRLNLLDERGYFTPPFKNAVHHLVDARQALDAARKVDTVSRQTLPDLREQSAASEAETARLRAEFNRYARPEDLDFEALQAALNKPSVSLADRQVLAQSFVWSYPTDPRQSEVAADLQQIEMEISRLKLGAQQAVLVRSQARAHLIKRAKAHDLTLAEWQDFLRDVSQQDLLNVLGAPQMRGEDYWIYSGKWTVDPTTQSPSGLRIDFNGTRVLSVVPTAP